MSSDTTTQFDPYYKWLGIPPAEQPPNHYRLLGVVLFESDADVIAAAADRQMAHVKSFATGRYAAASQKLLNELARARVCLLNPERKVEYDTQVREQQHLQVAAASTTPGSLTPTHPPPFPPGELLGGDPGPGPTIRVHPQRRHRRNRVSPGGMLLWVLVLGACLVGALFVLVQFTSG